MKKRSENVLVFEKFANVDYSFSCIVSMFYIGLARGFSG